ncbi:MAG: GuaB3 family IMP dehydrogenase-related protein [Dehalococcoidia bacterium]|nr:GuaB3 family IMP dehydrogenase-related protein [Dehalococcoidia bacterium]
MSTPDFKPMRHAYGFDDVAIVPGAVTINPELCDVSLELAGFKFQHPILASAMDAVTNPRFISQYSELGGLAVLNLEGLQARYDDPDAILDEVARAGAEEATAILQHAYAQPILDELIARRVQEIKQSGAVCAVSCTPASAKRLSRIAAEAGADIFVVQSTVTTARHISRSPTGLNFEDLVRSIRIPVVVGNTVGYGPTKELMQTGVAAVLVGVGPGAACTSREVLGIGVPQVSATIECAAARDAYYQETGHYVPIITDGGLRTGGDLCKAIAAGADGVMMASPFAATEEAPGKGHHWGMATPHVDLPRGTRVTVGVRTTLKQVLFGPTSRTDGTENFVGAIRTAMGMCGAETLRDFQNVELIVAPSIKTEGKVYQLARD